MLVCTGSCVIVMNNVTNKDKFWDNKLESVINTRSLNDVLKFHQSSVISVIGNKLYPYDRALNEWMVLNQHTDSVPNDYIFKINFQEEHINNRGSTRTFLHLPIKFEDFREILVTAFGKDKNSLSKRFPSAGALYPVIPLIYVLSDSSIDDKRINAGCYVYDSVENSIKKIKSWNKDELTIFKEAIAPNGELLSKTIVGYSIDVKKAVAKYKRRGYRHALIEVGCMAQSLRECINEININYGELCWSGFDDNLVAQLSGLNPKIAPIALLQWFGEKDNDSSKL